MPDRAPERLSSLCRACRARPAAMYDAAPTLVFATFGRARITGALSPLEEDRLLGQLITRWALASTLDLAELCAVEAPLPVRLPSSMRPHAAVALAASARPAARAVLAS
jgi:hypothetical protein